MIFFFILSLSLSQKCLCRWNARVPSHGFFNFQAAVICIRVNICYGHCYSYVICSRLVRIFLSYDVNFFVISFQSECNFVHLSPKNYDSDCRKIASSTLARKFVSRTNLNFNAEIFPVLIKQNSKTKEINFERMLLLELKTLIRFPISSSTHYFFTTLLKLSSFALLLQIIFIQSLVHEFTHGTQETGNFQCFFRSTLPPYGEGCVSQFKTAEYVMWKRI